MEKQRPDGNDIASSRATFNPCIARIMRHKQQTNLYSSWCCRHRKPGRTERERPKSSTVFTHRVAPPSVLRLRVCRQTRRLLAGSLPSPFHPCAASRRRALFVSLLPHTTERLHFAEVPVCLPTPLHKYDDESSNPCPLF